MRTDNTIKNILTTFIPFLIIGVLGFIKVRVFSRGLNDDIYSINQLFFQIFSYLSLAEAGFGLFIIQKYYDLFAKKDVKQIAKINHFAIIFFRKIGFVILAIGLIISFFIQLLTKANVSLTYLRIVFLIFIIKNTIDYFMMAPRYVMLADQKMYKINFLINFGRIFEMLLEIILVYFGIDYLYVLLPGILLRYVINKLINNKVYKEYEYLCKNEMSSKNEKFELNGLSNIVIQRISGIFYSSTDIILISTFVNPVSVIIYTSYNFITKFIFDMSYVVGSAITPSFASALKDKKSALHVFNQMNILFTFISSFVVICLYRLINALIVLWIGEKYLISNFGLLVMISMSFIDIIMRPMYMSVESEGLFEQIKNSTIMEALINLVISLLLVKSMGINGVLLGSLIAKMLTSAWYLPKVVYLKLFNKKPTIFLKQFIFSLFLVIIISIILKIINFKVDNVIHFIFSSIVVALITINALFVGFYFFSSSFRNLIGRFKYIYNSKRGKNA